MKANGMSGQMQGTKKVFSFTFVQLMKSKANLLGLLIFFLIAFFSLPISSVFGGGAEGLEEDQGLGEAFYSEAQLDYLRDQGAEEEVLSILGDSVDLEIGNRISDYQEEDDFSMSSYSMRLGYIIIVFMCCVLSISSIIRVVIEEKASKLVDLLMVSVKPLALLYGKVLAEILYMLCSLGVTILGLALSNVVFGSRFQGGFMGNLFAGGVHVDGNFLYVLFVIVVTALLAMLLFGILSGICGAGCATIEESNSAMGVSMILIFVGYFASVILMVAGGNTLGKLMSLIPPFSVFLMPTLVMIGKLGVGYVLISWGIMIICIALMLKFAARVYHGLIIYNGSTKKFRQILRMARKGDA